MDDNTRMIVKAVTFVAVPLVVLWVMFLMKKQSKKEEAAMSPDDFTITLPKAFLWIGVIDILFFAGCAAALTFAETEGMTIFVYLIFLLFISLGGLIIFGALRWKIRILGEEIRLTPLFSGEKKTMFGEIERVRKTSSGIKVSTSGGFRFSMDYTSVGYDLFLKKLEAMEIPVS